MTAETRDMGQEIERLQNRVAELEEQMRPKRLRVLTVRMPEKLHARLRSEAEANHVSMNQLAIDKLLLPVPEEMPEMPAEWSNGKAGTP